MRHAQSKRAVVIVGLREKMVCKLLGSNQGLKIFNLTLPRLSQTRTEHTGTYFPASHISSNGLNITSVLMLFNQYLVKQLKCTPKHKVRL